MKRRLTSLAVALTAGTLVCASASADSGRLMPRNAPPAYAQECGSCHTAYAPGLLPAASWQRVMSGLDKHYGTDASLDAGTVRELGQWLQTHAGTGKRASEPPPEDRITRAAWFVREHRKVDAAVWSHAAVKSAANCAACHTGADQGNFSERGLRIPPGLPARLQRGWND